MAFKAILRQQASDHKQQEPCVIFPRKTSRCDSINSTGVFWNLTFCASQSKLQKSSKTAGEGQRLPDSTSSALVLGSQAATWWARAGGDAPADTVAGLQACSCRMPNGPSHEFLSFGAPPFQNWGQGKTI